ncbi:MAG: MerC domain-containing protein [Acidobacteriota bacterium]|nr:MerC domain-containing protein [Blastocatellia bacterium]MDW8413040.1 MerC domain-containing protein [Acidobacteriota bacterium]
MKEKLSNIGLDIVGFIVSAGCALHCAALPLLLTLVPLVGLSFLISPLFESVVIAISLTVGMVSFVRGVKCHRKVAPAILFLLGFFSILVGRFHLSVFEQVVVPIGGCAIAASHLLNARLLKSYPCHRDKNQL